MTRGQVGSLGLTCTTLAFATSRRFIPAHSNWGPITPEYRTKPSCKKYAEPRKSNEIAYLDLSSKQRVHSSNLGGRATSLSFNDLRDKRRSFAVEDIRVDTELLEQARAAGYSKTVLFISTEDAQLNVGRVLVRMSRGGQAVPVSSVFASYGECSNAPMS